MKSESGPESYVSRKAMLITGIFAWVGGVALASAAGIYTAHHGAMETRDIAGVSVPDDEYTQGADTTATEGTEVLPADTVVAPRPTSGAAEMQSR
jgi:predicted outer membrane lipoprotein